MIHIFHRYGPWLPTKTSALMSDGMWQRYEIRHCRKCAWSKTRLSGERFHRTNPDGSATATRPFGPSGSSSGGTE